MNTPDEFYRTNGPLLIALGENLVKQIELDAAPELLSALRLINDALLSLIGYQGRRARLSVEKDLTQGSLYRRHKSKTELYRFQTLTKSYAHVQ